MKPIPQEARKEIRYHAKELLLSRLELYALIVDHGAERVFACLNNEQKRDLRSMFENARAAEKAY